MKTLKIKSIDLLKYTEEVITKQPTEADIKTLVSQYVDAVHPTHIAIAIPLDDNTDFLSHGHTPAPLTVDEFTRVWINTIHEAGINVYFRGSFCDIKNLYNFGFTRDMPAGTAGTALTDGKKTWLGRVYLWLEAHKTDFRQGDLFGLIPEATNNAFNGNFFILPEPNVQTNFLEFYRELQTLIESTLGALPVLKEADTKQGAPRSTSYTGLSSHVYDDVYSKWIPSVLFDLAGMLVVDYYGKERTPVELERTLNELYADFHVPIFLSQWADDIDTAKSPMPDGSDAAKLQGFLEAFIRLRDKGVLIGFNYFDGLDDKEGIFTAERLNLKGIMVKTLFAKNTITVKEPIKNTITKEEPTPTILQPTQKGSEKAVNPIINTTTNATQQVSDIQAIYELGKKDIHYLMNIFVYTIFGTDLAFSTVLAFNSLHLYNLSNLTPYLTIVYTLLIAMTHAIVDGR